jgi:hypothetical protein
MRRRPGPSPGVAGHRAPGHWPAATVAGRRLASPYACRGWLPTWLPTNSLAVLMFERSNGCVRCSREHGRAVSPTRRGVMAMRPGALSTAHHVQIADSGQDCRLGPRPQSASRSGCSGRSPASDGAPAKGTRLPDSRVLVARPGWDGVSAAPSIRSVSTAAASAIRTICGPGAAEDIRSLFRGVGRRVRWWCWPVLS